MVVSGNGSVGEEVGEEGGSCNARGPRFYMTMCCMMILMGSFLRIYS